MIGLADGRTEGRGRLSITDDPPTSSATSVIDSLPAIVNHAPQPGRRLARSRLPDFAESGIIPRNVEKVREYEITPTTAKMECRLTFRISSDVNWSRQPVD